MHRLICALAGGLLLASTATAQDSLEFGAPLPEADATFETTSGAMLSLGAASGAQGLAVVFWSDACPWVDKYTDRVASLAEQYGRAGVGFVLVQSEPLSEDAEGTPALAAPLILDVEARLATALGASNVPQAFFFGPGGTLVYQGAIDDSPASVARVQVPYLQQAMDQSIAGMPIEVRSTRALGCTLKTEAP